jgi:hypothetical protein
MKFIALKLALSSAALAQESVKLLIKAPTHAPNTTAAPMRLCPQAVTVTNKSDAAQYQLDLTGYTVRTVKVQPRLFRTPHVQQTVADHVNVTLFNHAGDAVATSQTSSPTEIPEQTCNTSTHRRMVSSI